MKNRIKKIWKDPVGSKLISAGIIGLFTILFVSMKSFFSDKSFSEILSSILNYEISILHLLYGLIGLLIIWIIWRSIKRKPKAQQYSESHKVLDYELLNKIKTELIPPTGSIAFLRENNFAGFAFRIDNLDDIYKFAHEFENPDFEFIDTDLNNILNNLKLHTKNFISLIGLNTWSISNHNINANTVPPEWETEQPERFWETVNKIHKEADGICSEYDQLIKTGRRKLTE